MGAPYGGRQNHRPTTNRRDANNRVLVQGRVTPELREKANRAAESLNISLALYLGELINRDVVDEAGRPTWKPSLIQRPEPEPELDLGMSA